MKHRGTLLIPEPGRLDPDDVFIVIIPTLDGTGNLDLIAQLYQATAIMQANGTKKALYLVVPQRFGVHNSMNVGCQRIAQKFGLKKGEAFRALRVDSDKVIENPEVLAGYVEYADKMGYNFMPSMPMKGPPERVYDGGLTCDPDLPEWCVIHPKGAGGLYYGAFPAEYPWHSDRWGGEDTYFLTENPSIEVRFAKRLRVWENAMIRLKPGEDVVREKLGPVEPVKEE